MKIIAPICKLLAVAFVLLLPSPKASFAQQELIGDLKDIAEQYEAIGLSVAVVKDNKIVFEENIGYKDKDAKTPLSHGDIFRIASISKSFTATALMQFVERGEISLDDAVSDLIGFPVVNPNHPEETITLRMLLSHTSSINDSQKYLSLDIINPDKNPDYAKCYSKPAPGTKYRYCNLNYNMAGAILEKLTGVEFSTYVVDTILKPLGLYGGYDADKLDASKFVPLYRYRNGKFTLSKPAYRSLEKMKENYQIGYSAPIFSPTGGMKISTADLAKYMMMHINYGVGENGQRIISQKSSEIMQSAIAKASETADYGLGIRLTRDFVDGKLLIGHTGSAFGLFSVMMFDREKNVGIIAITNGSKRVKVGNYNSLLKPTVELLYDWFADE